MDRNRNEAARADGGRPGRLFSSSLIAGLAAALCLFQPVPARSEDSVVLENEHLLVAFSAKDGVFTRIRNKKTGQELITIASAAAATRPWAMMLAPFELVSDFTKFRIIPPAADRSGQADLEWETPYQITVHATARLKPGADELELRCSAQNHGGRTILALRYPAVGGIGTLSADGKTDRLLHSTMMGALFFDPFHLFRGGSRILPERGVAPSRYPNGFHGSALQLMAYYTEGKGGFSITTRDPQGNDKDFNFYKMQDDKSLACEVAHIQADARPGKSLTVDYPAYITALDRGDWYAAAERYRAWALQQKWCERGPLAERVARNDASRWLLEQTGAVGAWWPFRRDIRDEIVRTRRFWGAPLMHLELWWSHDPSRMEAQREGDHFGPFYFPFLALRNREVFVRHAGDAIEPPATPISPDWVAMCPVQPGPRKVAVESAEDLVGTGPLRHHQIWIDENRTGCAADCLYFDVGPCAGVPTHCYAKNHGHPPGAGGAVTRAYVSLIQEMKERASRAKGAYVPVGTECVTEPFVGCLDFYYARNAGLNPDMENFPYVRDLSWLPDGRMEVVPLFPFVYHEHGPTAIQGIYPVEPWSIAEAESFFAWAAARSVLWGGIIVTGTAPASAPPAAREGYLRGLAAARVGFAREFLAYGRMQAPPPLDCEMLDVDHGLSQDGWLRKIRFPAGRTPPPIPPPPDSHSQKGASKELSVEKWATDLLATPFAVPRNKTLKVPSVLCQPYTLGDDRLGILVVNISTQERSLRLPIDPASYGLAPGTYELSKEGPGSRVALGTLDPRKDLDLKLEGAETVLVTARRGGPSGSRP